MAEGKFPNADEYMHQWSQALIDTLSKSAIDEMNANKAKSTSPSKGDVAESALIAGIRFAPVVLGQKIEFQILMPKGWNWLETGRSAGKMPPEEPIVSWIRRRGFQLESLSNRRKGVIKSLKTKRLRKGLKQYSPLQKAKQLAFLIRRKIGKEGTRATHFYSNVVTEKLITDLKTVMKEKFKKDITVELLTLVA